MTYKEWKQLNDQEKSELLEREKRNQIEDEPLEPEHIYLAVNRPRPKAEHIMDQIL